MHALRATVTRVADAAPVPWRNGGGVTRELLLWPDIKDWALRVSVADIPSSGPFSIFPGVDRWFAVLDGGAVSLATAGLGPVELTAQQEGLHMFPGDAATQCTALGATTRDFNLMARRARLGLRQRPLAQSPSLATRAEGVGLFVTATTALRDASGHALSLPAMALAWWPNPDRASLLLQVQSAPARGWWFEVDGTWRGVSGPY